MAIPSFNRATIRSQSSAESFNRGEEYWSDGSVLSIVQRGDQIVAEVQGSGYQPYTVTVELDGDKIVDADCTCPYDWGGWCKHIVAALLACGEEPERVEERPSLTDLLAGLDAQQLRSLIVRLAAAWPETVAVVERWLATGAAQTKTTSAAIATPPPTITLDLPAIRRQIKAVVRRGSEGMDDYLRQAERLLENGQSRDALALLEVITEAAVSALDADEPPYHGGGYRGDYYDDDDAGSEYYTLFEILADLWAEALLLADLAPEEREKYQELLGDWDDELGAIEWMGGDKFFSLGITALEYYWDYPPLQRVLAGEITDLGAWDGEAPYDADELAVVRLRVLERQGRLQEYLYLAEAEGQTALFINMLAQSGRAEEATAQALQFLQDAASAYTVAQTLYNGGHTTAAFRVAQHGLSGADQPKYDLALWLQEKASAAGDARLAVVAGRVAVLERRDLSDYLKLQTLAAEEWPRLREELLGQLRQKPTGWGRNAVAIFLHEKLIDDAIAALGDYASVDDTLAVMKAARQSRPDWVIAKARKQAESIMNAGKADHYRDAVIWLQEAKAATIAHGRQSEWANYLAQIREKHGRKWKLMGLMEGL